MIPYNLFISFFIKEETKKRWKSSWMIETKNIAQLNSQKLKQSIEIEHMDKIIRINYGLDVLYQHT